MPQTIRIGLTPSVRTLLGGVRRRIRQYSIATGLLFLVCVVGCVFWATIAVDTAWFALQKLELPVGLRAICLAILLPSLLWIIGSRLLFPLIRRLRDNDIALLLERKFPQFQDRLITSVESSAGYQNDGPLVNSMLHRSIVEADAIASGVNATDLFDTNALRRLAWSAAILTMSIVVYAIMQPNVMSRWYSAFIRCDDVYHTRTTFFEVSVIAQPGDRRRPFTQVDQDYVYRHPRGMDLELELVVPERSSSEGAPWVVPERVRIDVIRQDGSRSRAYVSATNHRVFRFVLSRLQEAVRLEFLAGDYRSTEHYLVEPVSLPTIDNIRLECRYPEYTRWNQLRETSVTVLGSEVSIPQGTTFELIAASAKPLQSVRIVTDWFEVSGDRESTRVVSREGFSVQSSLPDGMISPDGLMIRGQFRLVSEGMTFESDGQAAVPGQGGPSDNMNEAVTDALSQLVLDGTQLPIASNSAIRFFLHDVDDVMSVNPETLRIRGIRDEPPNIVARGVGIDNAITRLARIPVAGRITDDYGIEAAGFQFVVDDETNWRPRPFRQSPATNSIDFELARDENNAFELFEVQPLELSEGQNLTLAIVATDGNVIPAPGVSRSEPMLFRIVSNEELLSLLYTREIALRRRFEEVISQLEQVRDDLVFHQTAARRLDSGDQSLIKNEDATAVTTCVTRSGNTLRRQTNELSSIADGFDEIIQQLLNNAVPPQQLAENMRADILAPIRDVSGKPMSDADRALGDLRVAAVDRKPVSSLISISADRVSDVVSRLRVILESVRDMAEFHEALRDLKAILEEQQKLLDETKALQKRNLIDQLKLLD